MILIKPSKITLLISYDFKTNIKLPKKENNWGKFKLTIKKNLDDNDWQWKSTTTCKTRKLQQKPHHKFIHTIINKIIIIIKSNLKTTYNIEQRK